MIVAYAEIHIHLDFRSPDNQIVKRPYDKNASEIKIHVIESGTEEDVASILASMQISRHIILIMRQQQKTVTMSMKAFIDGDNING